VSTIANKYLSFLPPVLLVLLPTILYWRILFLGEVVYWGTPLLQFYPWRKLAVEIYKSGQIPLWNPYVGFGAPLAANLQSAVFYPLNFFYLFIPVERAMGYSIVLHVALAGLFMYLLGRVLGMSTSACMLAAIAYMFSGYIISRAHFISIVSAAPWLPLLMASTEGILKTKDIRAVGNSHFRDRPWGWTSLLAVGTAMLLLAGHMQLAFYSLLAICVYAIFKAAPIKGDIGVGYLAVIKLLFFGLSMAAGIALAGVQLIPAAELSLHSVRSSGAEYDFALTYSLWPWQIAGAVFPTLMGHPAAGGYWGPGNFWENAMYIGAVPLLLALIGAIKGRDRVRMFLVALAVASVILSLGYYTPIYPWVFNHLPGFGLFQAPSRLLFLYTFAAAILCGFGLDAVKEHVPKYLLRLGVAGGFAVLAMAGALALVGRGIGPISLWTAFHIAVTGLIFSISCILLLKYGDRDWNKAAIPLTALVFVELFIYGEGLNPTTSVELYRSPSSGIAKYLEEDRGLHRVYTSEEMHLKKFFDSFGFKDWGTTDWKELAKVRDQLPPDLSSAYGVFESYNYDPLRLRRASRLMAAAEEAGLPLQLTMVMNVKYLLNDGEAQSFLASSDRQSLPSGISEPRPFLPRAFVAPNARIVDGEEEALDILLSDEWNPSLEVIVEVGQGRHAGLPLHDDVNPSLEVIVERGAAGPYTVGSAADVSAVYITSHTPNRVDIDVESDGGLLVLSDTHYPGWRAYIDGEEKQVLVANYNFRAVALDRGRHSVIFTYESDSFKAGLSLSVLGIIVLVAMTVLWTRGRNNRRCSTCRQGES